MRKLIINSLLIALLISAALPGMTIQAQDDQSTLVERALSALEDLNAYQSYAVSSELTLHQAWIGGMNGQEMDGLAFEMAWDEQGTADLSGDNPNIQHTITVSRAVTTFNTPTIETNLAAEIRMVDGTLYVNAAYDGTPPADAPTLPDGWIVMENQLAFETWPGLAMVMNADGDFNNTETLNLLTGITIPDNFSEFVTFAAPALIDGPYADVFTLSVSKEGTQALGIVFTTDEPVMMLVFDQLTADPLTLTFFFDDQDRLVGLDFALDIVITDLDISSIGAPAGYTIDLDLHETYRARFTSINEPLARVEAPEVKTVTLPVFEPPAPAGELPWWNDRVFYEVFVRSFYDSDGDGIGDLRGLIEKLDYLNDGDPTTTDDLGVTGLWLMPISQSPSYHGYDVTDYYTIEEDYGTNQDFLDLMEAAHARGMVVIVDLVLNHTSSEHPWFVASREGDPDYADWYIWSDDPPSYRGPWGQEVWYPAGDRYYFALFWSGMPDLNYENPAVTTQMYDVTRFWLDDMGADGFRLDAIRHLDEDGPVMQNTPETLAWLEDFHAYVRSLDSEALTVGEVWDSSAAVAPYVGDKVDIAFEFDFATAILNAARWQYNVPLIDTLNTILKLYPSGQYATFLTNHDQNRIMSELKEDSGAAKVAASILLTSPGVPFIYYGEEVGMVGTKPDERIRTPMQWDDSLATAGFSTIMPWQRTQTNYKTNNVAAETDDPDSLLNHYRALVHLRNEHPALRTGTIQLVASSDSGVYSFLRYGENETLLIVINLSQEPITDCTLTVANGLLSGTPTTDLLFGAGTMAAPTLNEAGGFTDYTPLDELPPQSTLIIRLQ